MTPAMIAELARKIVEQQVSHELWFYLILLCLIFLAAFFGSLVRGYATDVGKFKAIEKNFEAVLEQLRKSTSATTEIQLALNHQDWSSREFKTLRREKLEGLLLTLYEVRETASKLVTAECDVTAEAESAPLNKLIAFGGLYFPELGTFIAQFSSAHHAFVVTSLESSSIVRKAKSKVSSLEFELSAHFTHPVADSQVLIAQLQVQLDAARVEYLERRQEFQLGLLGFYREIQRQFEVMEREVGVLMGVIIKPAD